jgi:hypothetical protein
MKNTTITLDEKTLLEGKSYAKRLGLSFNSWLAGLISRAVHHTPAKAMKNLLDQADKIAGDSAGKKWSRDEIYDR